MGTVLELEVNNLLNSSWYLPDLKCRANEALGDVMTAPALGDESGLDVSWCTWAIRSISRDCEIAFGLRHPVKGMGTLAK